MEVEIKFKVDNPEYIKKIVEEIADFIVEKDEVDLYFNHPCRDFFQTDEALRIRKDREGVTLTYKGKKVDFETKTREELKVKVEDFGRMKRVLEKLGFSIAGEVRKTRRIYRMDDVILCLDWIEELGSFVEIEIETEKVDEGKRKIFEIAETLGLKREKSIRKSYLEMILDVADSNRKR